MRSLFKLVVWLILAPFRIVKFILSDIIVFGIIGGTLSLIKAIVKTTLKIIFKPITLLLLAGAAAGYVVSDEERKNKVKALVGL
ncbi:MAG: hypothetical protein ACP5G0_04030 [Desulfomonilia bacterium]